MVVLDSVVLFVFVDFGMFLLFGLEGDYAMPECCCVFDEPRFVSSQAEVCTGTNPSSFQFLHFYIVSLLFYIGLLFSSGI